MKISHLLPVAAFALVSFVHAETASPFINDYDAAKKQAKAEHKDILVDFTGSDWCGFCIMLDKEVFHTPEYLAAAPAHFVSVQLDFPNRNKPPAEIQARNKAWKGELKSRSFPDVLLADENGKVYADTGYRAGGAKFYLEHMEELRSRRIKRDEAFALAAKAEGLEKAKHLDAALSALRSDEVLLEHYNDTIKQILALDAGDKAGLATKYKALFKRRQCEQEIIGICQGKDDAAMLATLKAYAEKPDIPVESKQYALYMAGAVPCERKLHDYAQSLQLYKQAIALAPDSPLVEASLKDAITRAEAGIIRHQDDAQKREISTMFHEVYLLDADKRYDEALEKIDGFAKKLSGPDRYNMMSRGWRILVKKGPADAALAKFKQLAEESPSDVELQHTLGRFLRAEPGLHGDKTAAELVAACAQRITDNPKAVRDKRIDAFLAETAGVPGEKPAGR